MKREVYPRPPALCSDRSFPPANEFREEVFFAGVRASSVDRAPFESDLGRNVERFCAPRCGPANVDLPLSHGVHQVDRLDAPICVLEEETRLLKRTFESITEFFVAQW